MNLHRLLAQRAAGNIPLRVALIGAGKFGSMFLSQVRRTPGMHLVAVCDLSPQRALASLQRVGWPAEQYAATSLAAAHKSDRKSTRLNSSHIQKSRMPSSA